MKATELRIGNWVMYSSKIQVNENKIRECVDYPERFAPIKLTEEWLERFGFKLPAHTWIGDKFHLSEYGEGSKHPNGGVWVVAMNKNNAIIAEIQYVHQLQNLYFALTGEELQTDETDKKVNQ